MTPNGGYWCWFVTGLAVQAAALILLAFGVARLKRSPHWQRTVWRAALPCLWLLVLGNVAGLPSLAERWLSPVVAESGSETRKVLTVTTQPAVSRPSPHAPLVSNIATTQPSPAPTLAPSAVWWPGWIWLAGALLLGGRMLVARAITFRFRRHTISVPSLLERVSHLSTRLDLRRPPRLFEAPGLHGPIAFGFLRPAICLPEQFAEKFSPAQRDAMLAHELGHLKAGDWCWQMAAEATVALLWWHPLVWAARHALLAAAEYAADDASNVLDDGPAALAESLVVIAREMFPASPTGGIAMAGSGFRSALGRRITRLLCRGTQPGVHAGRWMHRVVGVLLLLASLGTLAAAAHWPGSRTGFSGELGWRSSLAFLSWQALANAAESQSPDLPGTIPPADTTTLANDSPVTDSEPPALFSRVFRLDVSTLERALAAVEPQRASQFGTAPAPTDTALSAEERQLHVFNRLKDLLASQGVKISPPKTMFYNHRTGQLMVHATLSELDATERFLAFINEAPQQLVIEVKYAEISASPEYDHIPTTPVAPLDPSSSLPQPHPTDRVNLRELLKPSAAATTNNAPLVSILTPAQFRTLVKDLEQRPGTDLVSAPKVTTLSDRQAQIKVVDVRYVVTGLDRSGTNSPQPITAPFEFGPVLDVIPHVAADGKTIQMTMIPTIREFLGYDQEGGRLFQSPVPGALPVPLPLMRHRQVVSSAVVLDGQTVVLSPGAIQVEQPGRSGKVKKITLIFITPTLIDPAGNRIHPEG